MPKKDEPSVFRRGENFEITIQQTSAQYAVLKEWSANIPTMYFLDICVVGATKLSRDQLEKNDRKAQMVGNLENLDRPQHAFSYLLALIEKVSDLRGMLSDSELEFQILGDLAALRKFFKNAEVYESDEFVKSYLQDLRYSPIELQRPSYLEFLVLANNEFEIRDPVSPPRRLAKSMEILKSAGTLKVDKRHPVVILVLACLYGNNDAKKLMKFKVDPSKFNPENVLADIMAISRFARIKLEIEQLGRENKGRFLRADFITDDAGLIGVINCFTPDSVRHEELLDISTTSYEFTVKLKQLLPEIDENEYDQLLNSLYSAIENN
jgi:hypothetical protein